MRITAATVKNFKRIEDVAIAPEADRHLLLIGGKNAQGKTSVLDALTAAFGGAKALPSDPVRRGAKNAEIKVELDGGAMTIKRVVDKDGGGSLEVRDESGALRSPQAVLDRLVGARFLDPLAFLALPAAGQRATLLGLIAEADKIAGLDAERVRVFDRRTEVGRDLRKAEAELERLPAVTAGEAIDVLEVSDQLARAAAVINDHATAKAAHVTAHKAAAAAKQLVEDLRTKLAAAEKTLAEEEAAELAGAAARRALPDLDRVKEEHERLGAEMRRAADHNRKVNADQAASARRLQVAGEVTGLTEQRDRQNDRLEAIDAEKTAILAAAKLPVDGLGVDEDGVTMGGIPLAQASGAERVRVALALAIAASPGLQDVWIRDGSLLDEDSMALLAAQAEAAGVRCWLERVGTRDPGAIVIHDGKVA